LETIIQIIKIITKELFDQQNNDLSYYEFNGQYMRKLNSNTIFDFFDQKCFFIMNFWVFRATNFLLKVLLGIGIVRKNKRFDNFDQIIARTSFIPFNRYFTLIKFSLYALVLNKSLVLKMWKVSKYLFCNNNNSLLIN
jgi:hypothetical protein